MTMTRRVARLFLLLLFGGGSGPSSAQFTAYASPFRSHQHHANSMPQRVERSSTKNAPVDAVPSSLALVERNLRDEESPLFLNAIVLVAAGNLVLNMLRPDPHIIWQFRFPRILWEICIMVTATLTSSAQSTAPAMYVLLAFMLGTTALVDIFVWAPLFAIWAGVDNQDCTGGFFTGRPYMCRPNRTKGWGRLAVTMQSLFGGIFYLSSAISAWGEYTNQRDKQHAAQQMNFLSQWHQGDGGRGLVPSFQGAR